MLYNFHIKTKLEEKYTTIAQDYSRTIALINSKYSSFYLRHVPHNAKKVLDIGCGSGDMLVVLSKRLRNIGYYGVDPIQRFVDLAKEKLPASTILIASAEELPFENETFDFIFSHVVFQHIDRQKALMEIKRVLRPNGRVVITEVLAKQYSGSTGERVKCFVNQTLRSLGLLLRIGPIMYFKSQQYTKSTDWQELTAIHRTRRFTYPALVEFYNQHLPQSKLIRLSPQLISVIWNNT